MALSVGSRLLEAKELQEQRDKAQDKYFESDRKYLNTRQSKALLKGWKVFLDAKSAPPLANLLDRRNCAQLLQNVYNEWYHPSEDFGEASLQSLVGSTARLPQILGFIRQIFPRLISNKIVSIQPLDRPTGMVFNLEVRRGDATDPSIVSNWSAASGYADTSSEASTFSGTMTMATINGTTITVGAAKKLFIESSVELEQDMNAYLGLSASSFLNEAAIDEIAREIDTINIRAVRTAAVAAKTVTYGTNPTGSGYTGKEWDNKLAKAILMANQNIYDTRNAEGTFLICGSNMATKLMDLNTFRVAPFREEESAMTTGANVFGTLENQFMVYKSRTVPTDEIIVGRKGTNFTDSGVFYLPYILMFITERFLDPSTQSFKTSYMTRFANYTAHNEYYARVLYNGSVQDIS